MICLNGVAWLYIIIVIVIIIVIIRTITIIIIIINILLLIIIIIIIISSSDWRVVARCLYDKSLPWAWFPFWNVLFVLLLYVSFIYL